MPAARSAYVEPTLLDCELPALGLVALYFGVLVDRVAAYRRASDSEDRVAGPRAAFNLGVLLAEQGDTEGAMAAFRRASDSDDPEVAPRAQHMLNRLDR